MKAVAPVGARLPAALAAKLAAGAWLRTAHRGLPGVAPGNSRRAVEAAAALGVDLIEIDVHASRDGRLVLWHDDDVHGVPIKSSTLEELRRVDVGDGSRVMELGDALEIAAGRAGLMIDLKADGLGRAIHAELSAQRFETAVVCGHYRETLRELRRIAPNVGTSLTLSLGWRLQYRIPPGGRIETDAVTVNHRLLTRRLIDELHASGAAVLAWTVDDPSRMRELLERGVDGLTSNRADVLVTLDARRPGSRA